MRKIVDRLAALSRPRRRTLAIVRSHVFTTRERTMADRLRPVFGDNVVLALDASRGKLDGIDIPNLQIARDTLDDLNLDRPIDWGWRCGDYFYYAVRKHYPEYDRYWLIEPDVAFNKTDPLTFFSRTDRQSQDFLAASLRPSSPDWPHYIPASLHFKHVHSCLFPLTRLSGRAIDAVYAERVSYIKDWWRKKEDGTLKGLKEAHTGPYGAFANDESFVSSAINANKALSSADLFSMLPDLFPDDGRQFSYYRMVLRAALDDMDAGVIHPVVSPERFLQCLAAEKSQPNQVRELGFFSEQVSKHLSDAQNAEFVELANALLLKKHYGKHSGGDLPTSTIPVKSRTTAPSYFSIGDGPHMVCSDYGKIRRFQVVGERCSGTNFVDALAINNLDLSRGLPFPWKHGFPAAVAIPSDLVLIVVFRNALDWVRSVYGKPWHSADDVREMPFGQFLRSEWNSYVDKPRYFRMQKGDRRVGNTLQLDRHPVTGHAMENIIQLRNSKNDAFLGIANRGVNAVFVQHEWVTDHPEEFVDRISEVFSISRTLPHTHPEGHYGWDWPERRKQVKLPPKGLEVKDRRFVLDRLDMRIETQLGYSY